MNVRIDDSFVPSIVDLSLFENALSLDRTPIYRKTKRSAAVCINAQDGDRATAASVVARSAPEPSRDGKTL
jgi:hypothetical protein